MIKGIIGYTGFVGNNLIKQEKFNFFYNSSNIGDIDGQEFDLLVIAAPSAVKWKANQQPEQDLQMINDLINHLKKVRSKQVIQVSTIDIYKEPTSVDEDTRIETEGLQPYGKNRFYLEEFIRKQFKNHLIVRLPAIFGDNLKKNFIYDILNPIPTMLTGNKFNELSNLSSLISTFYIRQENNSYLCKEITKNEKTKLENFFKSINFSSLNFTDSRSIFQFYNLKHLWEHIQISLDNKINTLNVATEPISVAELYNYLTNDNFINEITPSPSKYNFKTKYSKIFDGQNGYIYNKKIILEEIKKFINIHG